MDNIAAIKAGQSRTNSLLTDISKATTTRSFSLDAGARARVSTITTLGDYKTLGADEALLLENVGTGTGTWANNQYGMSVTSGQYLIRKSKKFHPYFSGKSQQVELTLINFSGSVSLVVQNNGTDVFRVSQMDWNMNPLPDHDWSKFNVIIFDFLWLGGAMLRTFVVTAEGIVLVDIRTIAGSVAGTIFKSPNQPVRYEIRSDGTTTTKRVGYFSSNTVAPFNSNKDGVWLESMSTSATGSMTCVCSQVSTEGSIEESGKVRSVHTGTTGIPLASIGTTYPIKALRLNSTFFDRYVKLTGVSSYVNSTNDVLLLTVQLNPTLSAPLTYTSVSNSAAQEATGNGTITVTTPGTVLFSQIVRVDSIYSSNIFLQDFLSVLGITVAGVSDQLVLCGTPITASVTSFGSINYKEY